MASRNTFSINDAVSYGWKSAKKNWGFLIVCILIMVAVNAVPSFLSTLLMTNDRPNIATFVIQIIGWVLQMAVSLGIIGVALKLYDKKKAVYSNMLDYFQLIIPYFLGSIIYMVIVVVGLILLVVPGIVWSIKFRYFTYYMVDRNMGPIDALKASAKITEGVKWKLFFFGLVVALINVVGALLLLVGLLFTIPLSIMAEVYVYRKLAAK